MPAIVVKNVTKVYRTQHKDPGLLGAAKALFRPRYGNKVAVDQLNFAIDPGEIVGYIGVNGAGKSTTIKMLTGIMVPTSGEIRVLGRDPHWQRVANAYDIGVVFGHRTQLWWDLALIESLNLIAKMYELEPTRYKRLLQEFSATLELEELLHLPIRTMSLGQKMRAELAATLIHEPKIVYLDEPTIGLDLIVKERIRACIKDQNRKHNTTVVLTTHDLGDIEELCQRLLIIDAGKLIYDGPLSTIKDRFGIYRTIIFEIAHPIEVVTLPFGTELIEQTGQRLVLRFDRTLTTASQVVSNLMNRLEIVDFSLTEPDLGVIIKHIYNGGLREEVSP